MWVTVISFTGMSDNLYSFCKNSSSAAWSVRSGNRSFAWQSCRPSLHTVHCAGWSNWWVFSPFLQSQECVPDFFRQCVTVHVHHACVVHGDGRTYLVQCLVKWGYPEVFFLVRTLFVDDGSSVFVSSYRGVYPTCCWIAPDHRPPWYVPLLLHDRFSSVRSSLNRRVSWMSISYRNSFLVAKLICSFRNGYDFRLPIFDKWATYL